MHCGHAGLPMYPSWLVVPANPNNPMDDPNFVSHMRGVVSRPLEPLVAGAPPSFHNLARVVGKGFLATSLEELLRPLVSVLPAGLGPGATRAIRGGS